jgi:hypothetical protein
MPGAKLLNCVADLLRTNVPVCCLRRTAGAVTKGLRDAATTVEKTAAQRENDRADRVALTVGGPGVAAAVVKIARPGATTVATRFDGRAPIG